MKIKSSLSLVEPLMPQAFGSSPYLTNWHIGAWVPWPQQSIFWLHWWMAGAHLWLVPMARGHHFWDVCLLSFSAAKCWERYSVYSRCAARTLGGCIQNKGFFLYLNSNEHVCLKLDVDWSSWPGWKRLVFLHRIWFAPSLSLTTQSTGQMLF